MKPQLFLIFCFTLAYTLEGAFVMNYLCGGSNTRVIPVESDKYLIKTAPTTPVSEKRFSEEKVVPLNEDNEGNLEPELKMAPNFNFEATQNENKEKKGMFSWISNMGKEQDSQMTSKDHLKLILKKSKIISGFESLSEEEAAALCEIEAFFKTVLDPKQRNQLLLQNYNHHQPKYKQIRSKHFKFSDKIGAFLANARDLKGFLKVVLRYYSVCFRNVMFDKILKAIIKSQVLNLEELTQETNMEVDQLFRFSCVHNDLTSAKRILELMDIRADIVYNIVMEAIDVGRVDLVKGLLGTIKKYYETDDSAIYQKIKNLTETIRN